MRTGLTDFPHTDVSQSFHLRGDGPVASRGPDTLTAADLRSASAAIRSLLPADVGGEWCLSIQSPFLLLATLYALQGAGGTPLLLPHTRPALLARLSGSCRGFITDEALPAGYPGGQIAVTVALPELKYLLENGGGTHAIAPEWSHPVGFMTSGSSGDPSRVLKTPAQLIAEVELLESAFGERIRRQVTFCGTTSHQHLFGFTFRLMWPLLTGRPLADAQIRIPGEVGTSIRTHGRIVLISSPAFLERAATLLDTELLSTGHLLGFSSGGPLDPDIAGDFNRLEDVSLIEIYGSTETGALAWRITEHEPAPPWRPLPRVSIHTDELRLSVSGPHLPGPGLHLTEDLVEPTGDGFYLKGRRDQIVKVADKRVSLTELNRLLGEHPRISEGRVIQLENGALAGILVPTEGAWADIAEMGKRAFCSGLRDHLSESVDRVTTPKRWRIIRQLPRNTQGKLEHEQLIAQFHSSNDAPQWQARETGDGHWLGEGSVEPDLVVLEGHFPGHPLVPGVALVHWAATVARSAFGIDHLTGSMQAIKFRNPVLPGTTLQLKLKLDTIRCQVSFQYFDDQRTYSSGRLSFRDA